MAKVKLYNQTGADIGMLELDPAVFEVTPNPHLIHEAVVAQQANSRKAIADTKDRSEVRGGGKKPWKQKGTGRARHGSIRSPIWKGGGVTFGPTSERNFSLKMNIRARRKALVMTLSDKANHNRIIALDTLTLAESKTKFANAMLGKLSLSGKKILVITPKEGGVLVKRAMRNIPKVGIIGAASLNVVDVLSHDYLLVSKDSVDMIVKTYKKS